MCSVALVYPHQLFADNPVIQGVDHVILVEDPLYFKQYSFHRQKLILHRASMQKYAARLRASRKIVHTVEANELSHSADIASHLARQGFQHVKMVEPCDDWLSRRISKGLTEHDIALTVLPDPSFLTPEPIIQEFDRQNKRRFFTKFYIEQRKRLGILLEADGTPKGGTWSIPGGFVCRRGKEIRLRKLSQYHRFGCRFSVPNRLSGSYRLVRCFHFRADGSLWRLRRRDLQRA